MNSAKSTQPPAPPPKGPGNPPVPPPPAALSANQQVAQGQRPAPKIFTIEQMVKDAYIKKVSDIHIRVGSTTRYRIRGELVKAPGQGRITPEIFEAYLTEILTPVQRQQFAEKLELDTAIFYPGVVRCRVNCFQSLNGGAMVLRLINLNIPAIDELGLPDVLKDIITRPQGLILVTGPTGSGKSTTMAAMIRHLNENAKKHIVTIEDPIEFVHQSLKCLISQREVGLHTHEFHDALRAVLREDPDVILIGEMRDRNTVNTALQAAQTGHLVLGTLHTRSAINAINRLLNLYNADEQPAIRVQITDSLVAVIAQLLMPNTEGGRTAVHDILINTPAMQDYLLKGNEEDALRLMEKGSHDGMQIINQALYQFVLEGRIAIEEAEKHSPDPNDLDRRLRTGGYDAASAAREINTKTGFRPL